MKNIEIDFTNERIIPTNSLAVVGTILGKNDFTKQRNCMDITKNRPQHQTKNGDILLTIGKPTYETVHKLYANQDFYKYALNITRGISSKVPPRQHIV